MVKVSPRNGPAASWSPWLKPPSGRARCASTHFVARSASCKVAGVVRRGVERAESVDHPTVLACVEMLINAWDADGSSLCVIECKEVRAVFAFDHIGVLTDVEGAFGASKEFTNEAMYILGGGEVFR